MFNVKNILVPTDGSPRGDKALSHAVRLARQMGSTIHLLHVYPPRKVDPEGKPADRLSSSADVARDLRLPEGADPVPIRQIDVGRPSVPNAIIEYARDHAIDLIVMGGRGRRGLGNHHLGGVAGPVVRQAPCSVLTVRERVPDKGVRRIVVPVDLSEPSRMSSSVARHVAAAYGAEVDLLMVLEHVFHPASYGVSPSLHIEHEIVHAWEEKLSDFWNDVDGPAVPFRVHVRLGRAGPEIINFSLQRAADLVVIGTHGKTGLRRFVLGSVAEHVVSRSLCATLTVKTFGRSMLSQEQRAGEALMALGAV
jgi:nucleotide-binding universal stress UspA family protein